MYNWRILLIILSVAFSAKFKPDTWQLIIHKLIQNGDDSRPLQSTVRNAVEKCMNFNYTKDKVDF